MLPLQSPPALQAPAPTPASPERQITFPGFNGFILKGTVRPAKGSGYFAVMVAGVGPTDRDWSSPLLGIPSHGGRDLSAWLATQGLGSLRYDKRFIGSTDPTLDVSLDAQVGDIRAALTAARNLPEAQGKKLLLVGHSEGALLGLLAAGEADAMVAIGLPPESMGALIEKQVGLQLQAAPEEARKANRDYLHSVLEAIRNRSEAPEQGALVYPGLARLGRSLMAPESLDFVRGTLDLDPWVLARRCPVPLAVVYGDKDMQALPPNQAPAGFKGAFLLIPNANHLLKEETRPASELSPSLALQTYGDDTPLADLDLLAGWLKQLK